MSEMFDPPAADRSDHNPDQVNAKDRPECRRAQMERRRVQVERDIGEGCDQRKERPRPRSESCQQDRMPEMIQHVAQRGAKIDAMPAVMRMRQPAKDRDGY